jgi:hypothetical protein
MEGCTNSRLLVQMQSVVHICLAPRKALGPQGPAGDRLCFFEVVHPDNNSNVQPLVRYTPRLDPGLSQMKMMDENRMAAAIVLEIGIIMSASVML